MNHAASSEILGQGKFLRLIRRAGWEYVERTSPVRAAFIGAITDAGCLILTSEFRVPIGQSVLGCPAGLIGDLAGQEAESLEAAVKRELLEETGYEAGSVTWMTEGPTSPGQTNEVIAIVLAEGLRKVGAGGGVEGEHIELYEIPLAEVDTWLQDRASEGCLIDPKIYAVLYFIRQRFKAVPF